VSAYRVPRHRHGFAFDRAVPPALTVPDGAQVTFETLDCFSNLLTSADQRFAAETDLLALVGDYNPVTGPVYVTGARPGDLLEVTIVDIRLGTAAPFAVTTTFGTGSRIWTADCPGLPATGHTRICPLDDDHVLVPTGRGTLRIPARAMVGTIGTAPAAGAAPSLRYGADHGGNVDCPAAGPGAVLRLPVNAPGALLSVGDVHALMGDAEIAGTALETSADVTVRLRIRPAAGTVGHGPTLDDPEHIGVIGCVDQADLTGNIEAAMLALHHRLCHEYALPPVDAYDLLGALARIRVNQCVVGGWSSVYVAVPRAYLPSPVGGDG
jgi:amidase